MLILTKKKVSIKQIINTIIVCLLFILLGINYEASALALAPALIKIDGEAGESFIQKVTLYNDVNKKIILYPSLENFKPHPETGAPVYLGNTDINAAASWIQLNSNALEINPGEKKDIILNIKISELAEPGGHYAALFWSDEPNTGAVNTANRIAQIFFFSVKGEVKESLQLVNFTKKINNNLVTFDLNLENNGNIHLEPSGEIKIFNWKKELMVAEVINPLKQNILPQSRRVFNTSWSKNNLQYGLYYATADVFYGADNKELKTDFIKFWILPENFFSWVGGGVVVIVLLIIVLFKVRKNS